MSNESRGGDTSYQLVRRLRLGASVLFDQAALPALRATGATVRVEAGPADPAEISLGNPNPAKVLGGLLEVAMLSTAPPLASGWTSG